MHAHVQEMKQYVENGNAIGGWDGLFQEIFANKDLLDLDCEQKESGEVVCTHTSDDDCYGEKLAKAHAEFVTLLLNDIDTKDEDNEYLIDDQEC
mmetsp:Transcript_23531/g.42706  ORF Transcript_23531/g.42706 Transcript_23531/m.42706 type:complete len:94 (-) Transcript_23531:780-1061(-)